MSNRWILLCAGLAGGIAALLAGFLPDWDFLNYHLYNPHALLNGRLAIDVAPAQQQTFLNPALHLPFYLLFRDLGPAALTFTAGVLQASQVVLLLMLLRELLGDRLDRLKILLPVAILGVLGPIFLNQLGGTQGDTLLSLPVLGALLLIVRDFGRADGRRTLRAGAWAGLLLGLAGALKLTLLPYAAALGVAAFALFPGARRWTIGAGLAAGGLAGLLLAGGPWFLHQWDAWGNPLLPYFNDLFRSPWVSPEPFRDLRFMPRDRWEWIFYPAFWLLDGHRVWEYGFRDLRVPLLIVASFALPVFAWRRMRREMPALGLVWLFIAVSYLLWLQLFSIYRYLSVLELLAPVVLFASALLFVHSRRGVLTTLSVLLATQLLVDFHRVRDTWELRMDADTALRELPPGAMVLLDGYAPLGFIAVWLPDEVPLVRIRANFMNSDEARYLMHREARQRARTHPGPAWLALPESERNAPFVAADLARVGFQPPDLERCVPAFRSATLQARLGVSLCPLTRTTAAEAQAPGR